jgi:hypothetical protein
MDARDLNSLNAEMSQVNELLASLKPVEDGAS